MACPTTVESPMAKPKSSGIIIRASGFDPLLGRSDRTSQERRLGSLVGGRRFCTSSGAKACAIRLVTPASVRQRERWVSRSLFPHGTVGLASDGVRARRPERTRRSPVSQGSALWTTSALAVGEVVRGLTRSSCEASCCWRAPVRRVDSRAGWSGVFGDPLHGVVAGPRRGLARPRSPGWDREARACPIRPSLALGPSAF
jgi:hypothetical protein